METIEQLKQRAEELRQSPVVTNERINAINETAWKLRTVDIQLSAQLGAEALRLSSYNEYLKGRAYALLNIGSSQFGTDQYNEAVQNLEASRRLFVIVRDEVGLATVINALEATRGHVGNHETSSENYTAALRLYQKAGDYAGMAIVLGNLGSFHYRFGEYVQALDYCYRALQAAVDSHLPIRQAPVYNNLGNILWRVGESELAIEYLQRGEALLQQHLDRRNKGMMLHSLGAVYHSRREYQRALDNYERSLAIAQEVHSFATQAEAQRCIGSVYCEIGEFKSALAHLWQSLEISQNIGSRFYKSETLFHLGIAHRQLGDSKQSVEMLERALELSEQLNSREVCYKAHLALSETYELQGKPAAALAHYQNFYKIWQEVYGSHATRQIQRLLLHQELAKMQGANQLPQQSVNANSPSALSNEPSALSPRKLQQITDFINHHLEDNLTLNDIADVAGLSKRYFQRSFKQSTGKTPHQFLLEQRVARAKTLLATTELPLTEIALRCGFSSQSHLSTQFRLTTSLTPRQFRQSL